MRRSLARRRARPGSGLVVTWRRAQMILPSAGHGYFSHREGRVRQRGPGPASSLTGAVQVIRVCDVEMLSASVTDAMTLRGAFKPCDGGDGRE